MEFRFQDHKEDEPCQEVPVKEVEEIQKRVSYERITPDGTNGFNFKVELRERREIRPRGIGKRITNNFQR